MALNTLKLVALTFALSASGCGLLKWTPTPRHFCPHIIPEEQYEKLETISQVTILPMDEYYKHCPENTLGCMDPWVNKETRKLAFAHIWLPERLPVEMRQEVIHHELCHADEIDRGIDPAISARHVGWIEPKGLYHPDSIRVMATLP